MNAAAITNPAGIFGHRLKRVHESMSVNKVDVVLLSLGADLPWLTGYTAMPLERLTMLVVPAAGATEQPTLLVPALEAPRVNPVPEVFSIRPWAETEDPVAIAASLVRSCTSSRPAVAISDRAWAMFLLRLQDELSDAVWRPASNVMAPLRAIKDEAEVEALAKAAAAADRVAAALLKGLGGDNEAPARRGERESQFRYRRIRAKFGQPAS
jgi:Xaa-Pro aminopeptidase